MPKKYIYCVHYTKTTSTVPDEAQFFWDLVEAKSFAQTQVDDYDISDELYNGRRELGVTSFPMFLFEKESLVTLWLTGHLPPKDMHPRKPNEKTSLYVVTGKHSNATTYLFVHSTMELANQTVRNLESVNAAAKVENGPLWGTPGIVVVSRSKFTRKFLISIDKKRYQNGWYSQAFLDGYYGIGQVKALQSH